MPWETRRVPVCDAPGCTREGCPDVLPYKINYPPELGVGQRTFLLCSEDAGKYSLLDLLKMTKPRRGVQATRPDEIPKRRR